MEIKKVAAWLQVVSTVAGITFFGLWPNSGLQNLVRSIGTPESATSITQRLELLESELNRKLGQATQWKSSMSLQRAQIVHAQIAQANSTLNGRLIARARELESAINKLNSDCQLAQSALNELPQMREQVSTAPDRVAYWIALKQRALIEAPG